MEKRFGSVKKDCLLDQIVLCTDASQTERYDNLAIRWSPEHLYQDLDDTQRAQTRMSAMEVDTQKAPRFQVRKVSEA